MQKSNRISTKPKLKNIFKFDDDESLMEIPFEDVHLVRKPSDNNSMALGHLFGTKTPSGDPSHFVLKRNDKYA